MVPSTSPVWPDERPLLRLGDDVWRIQDACEGTIIFGATGSGKTSGSGSALARSFLSAGFGGLVLCAKSSEPDLWIEHAAATGRSSDLILFGNQESWAFNFLEYESMRVGPDSGLTENLVSLFMEVASLGSGEARSRGGDPFWDRSMRSLIRNCVDLISMSGAPVSMHTMFDVVRSAAPDLSSVSTVRWQKTSTCWRMLNVAKERAKGQKWEVDCAEVAGFWLTQFPSLGDKTRGSIFAMFSTLAESLMRGKMRELFCSETTLSPNNVLEGKIVIVNLPVKQWDEVGRMAAVIWKYCVQKAIERRADNHDRSGRPLFIWADECQHFTSRYDTLFQATARSSRAASVYLTQNYSSLVSSMGGGFEGKALTDSLIGNMGTKIFHSNNDRETNLLTSEMAGRNVHAFRSVGANANLGFSSTLSAGVGASRSKSEHIEFDIQPTELSALKKGGKSNEYVSEAVILQTGRVWRKSSRSWQKVNFRQELSGESVIRQFRTVSR